MARTLVSALQTDVGTGALSASNPANSVGGNNFANNGEVMLAVINGGASPSTVTFTTVAKYQGFALTNPAPVVTNGTTRYFGPFDPSVFNQTDGTVWVDFSYTTSVTIIVIKLK